MVRCAGYVHLSFEKQKHCIAQLWKLTNNSYSTGYLQNRNGTWKYGDKIFTIPDEGTSGIIKDQVWGIEHGLVLGLMNETLLPNNAHGNPVILEEKNKQISDGQTWLRSNSDENGWFTLQNPTSGLYLTGHPGDSYPTLEGMNNFMYIHTQVFSQNRTLAIFRCKMAFFSRAWQNVKVLPQPSTP